MSRRRTLSSAEEAARWLLERWPRHVDKPRSFRPALQACLQALDGRTSPNAARNALIKAADDAGILDRA